MCCVSVGAADGKCLACTFRVKFVEVSVGINHNVDELLAGILTQIRLKQEHNIIQVSVRAPTVHMIVRSMSDFFVNVIHTFPCAAGVNPSGVA